LSALAPRAEIRPLESAKAREPLVLPVARNRSSAPSPSKSQMPKRLCESKLMSFSGPILMTSRSSRSYTLMASSPSSFSSPHARRRCPGYRCGPWAVREWLLRCSSGTEMSWSRTGNSRRPGRPGRTTRCRRASCPDPQRASRAHNALTTTASSAIRGMRFPSRLPNRRRSRRVAVDPCMESPPSFGSTSKRLGTDRLRTLRGLKGLSEGCWCDMRRRGRRQRGSGLDQEITCLKRLPLSRGRTRRACRSSPIE
jgi:hypothetical protein